MDGAAGDAPVRRLPESRPGVAQHFPYFVVLQSDLLSNLATVIVAPAIPQETAQTITRLNPIIEIDGESHIVTMQGMAGVPRSRLGATVANVSAQHGNFVAAVDLIFTGV
jgi:toxin CcdB